MTFKIKSLGKYRLNFKNLSYEIVTLVENEQKQITFKNMFAEKNNFYQNFSTDVT